MHTAPHDEEIKKWLMKRAPLDLFRDDFSITDIDPKPWSGHFNYRIETRGKKFVLRFKGPEWGDKNGTAHEYKILKKLEKHRIAPRAHYCTKNFFGEPMMLEEYMEGKLFIDFSKDAQKKYFPDIARYIATINSVPFRKNSFPFSQPLTSYAKSKRIWKTRIHYIVNKRETRICGKQLALLLPQCEQILNAFDNRLRNIIKKTGSSFIFESAHAGHCLKTKAGFRFLNWEKVNYGDPSYTLAVFLTSLYERPDFETIKTKMIKAYLTKKHVPEFAKLVEQRIIERRISNIIWSIYTYAKKESVIIPHWHEKIKELKSIIEENNDIRSRTL